MPVKFADHRPEVSEEASEEARIVGTTDNDDDQAHGAFEEYHDSGDWNATNLNTPLEHTYAEVTKDEVLLLLDALWIASSERDQFKLLSTLYQWRVFQREPFVTWMRDWVWMRRKGTR
jgi:hypothetical protein